MHYTIIFEKTVQNKRQAVLYLKDMQKCKTPRKKVPQHRAWHTERLTLGYLTRYEGARNQLILTKRRVHSRAYYVPEFLTPLCAHAYTVI